MLPRIKSTERGEASSTIENFKIQFEGIEDLFIGSSSRINPKNEVRKIQSVLNNNNLKLEKAFNKDGFDSMNRGNFQEFVYSAIGIRGVLCAMTTL